VGDSAGAATATAARAAKPRKYFIMIAGSGDSTEDSRRGEGSESLSNF
jgi:hypothetical protein